MISEDRDFILSIGMLAAMVALLLLALAIDHWIDSIRCRRAMRRIERERLAAYALNYDIDPPRRGESNAQARARIGLALSTMASRPHERPAGAEVH